MAAGERPQRRHQHRVLAAGGRGHRAAGRGGGRPEDRPRRPAVDARRRQAQRRRPSGHAACTTSGSTPRSRAAALRAAVPRRGVLQVTLPGRLWVRGRRWAAVWSGTPFWAPHKVQVTAQRRMGGHFDADGEPLEQDVGQGCPGGTHSAYASCSCFHIIYRPVICVVKTQPFIRPTPVRRSGVASDLRKESPRIFTDSRQTHCS